MNVLMGMLGQSPIILSSSIHLPIGISFFTLQALTYLIDVYKARAPVQTNPLNVGLYISLFPQLLAGPIVRYQNFAGQIVHRFTTIESFAYGTRRFIIGLAKKVIIANTLATASDGIFGIPSAQLTPSLAWFGILCYTLQIYYDFSSYSDMAIGLGYMFGFRFPENFNYPYIAGSITDFWCRWHITLATWFRDYVYIPCGGNRKGILRKYVNLILVFFLCGLWHGASWNFLVWGLMHGSILIIERWTGLHDSTNKRGMLQHIYVNFFHMIGLVVFRSESLAAALSFLSSMVGLYKGTGVEYHTGLYTNGPLVLVLLIALVGCTPLLPFVKDRLQQATGSIFGLRPVVEICTISVLIMVFGATLCVMAAQTNLPFIYFRF
ncbi:MAG: MBOAT family O-acyltransferase [Gemmatimonadota bacterium]|nr:MBOAT family O-acyltransferase [Gemmatimonadota bacterium]